MTNFLATLISYFPSNPMSFYSVLFIIAFSAFYGLYLIWSSRPTIRNILLLIFSLYFYWKISGFWIFLLVFMGSSDYLIGLLIGKNEKESTRKALVILSVLINIGSLFAFKYINFFLESWAGIIGEDPGPYLIRFIKPIGISYFVFKSLTYIFDLNREIIEKPEKNYLNYLLYVSFFPNILAGPIAKARDLLPQFRLKSIIDRKKISEGFFLILTGVFKKVVIADYLAANFVDRVFDAPQFFTGFESLMASYGYTVQLYFDFSGYTDMVIGIALLLGFTTEANFNKPFLAQNISEFWRRWHLTLSTWLNEFLFTPMSFGFRRFRKAGILLAVTLTFTISGLWHGPNWTFIIWGLSHGIAMAWDQVTIDIRKKIKGKTNPQLYKIISIILCFHFLVFSMVIFRAESLGHAKLMYSKIFTELDFSLAGQWISLYILPFMMLIFALVVHYLPTKVFNSVKDFFSRWPWWLQAFGIGIGIILIYQVFSSDAQAFIYLKF